MKEVVIALVLSTSIGAAAATYYCTQRHEPLTPTQARQRASDRWARFMGEIERDYREADIKLPKWLREIQEGMVIGGRVP